MKSLSILAGLAAAVLVVSSLQANAGSIRGPSLLGLELGKVALNPQPLPPGSQVMINPQPLPPGGFVMLNPQPLPPRIR